MRPRLLDLFCGAGGATKGYQRAGFYVVGVDHLPQPNYCGDEFYRLDALSALTRWDDIRMTMGIAAVHASPPCQAKTTMSNRWRGFGGTADEHVNLIPPTIDLLEACGPPWVCENVPGARSDMPTAFTLHGGMFGLGVHRPRLFESSVAMSPPRAKPAPNPLGVYGKAPDGRLLNRRADGTEQRAASSVEEAGEAMGIDWMTWGEIREAIPPAYTEWIGARLIEHLNAERTLEEAA